jgi:hypothetical protein
MEYSLPTNSLFSLFLVPFNQSTIKSGNSILKKDKVLKRLILIKDSTLQC